MIWKCLIVDDEPPAIKIIKGYIELVADMTVIASCSNVLQAMEILKKGKNRSDFSGHSNAQTDWYRFFKNIGSSTQSYFHHCL